MRLLKKKIEVKSIVLEYFKFLSAGLVGVQSILAEVRLL